MDIPYKIENTGLEFGEVKIYGKRIFSFVSDNNTFPSYFTLYNWHELCIITQVYFKNREDILNSVTGIALIEENLFIQLDLKNEYIQVQTPCPKWLIEELQKRFKNAEKGGLKWNIICILSLVKLKMSIILI